MMITAARRRSLRSAMYARLTDSGIVPVRKADVKAGHGYYLGASSSPSFVLTLEVTDQWVRYCNSYSLVEQRMERWIFEDLSASAHETVKRDAAAYAKAAETADESTAGGRLTKQCARVAAERLAAHGAPVCLSNYDRYEVRVMGAPGVDVYGIGKNYGVVGNWDDSTNVVDVECSDEDMCAMLARESVTKVSARLVKACPRA